MELSPGKEENDVRRKRGIADAENGGTTETMADYARELEASFRTIREGDVIPEPLSTCGKPA